MDYVLCVLIKLFSTKKWIKTLFFQASRDLRQGFPLSPYLFLLIVEGLSRALSQVWRSRKFQGVVISNRIVITHLLFVDDILLFRVGTMRKTRYVKEILDLYTWATGMVIKCDKSSLYTYGIYEQSTNNITRLLDILSRDLDSGLKYMGFVLNPHKYWSADWKWLVDNIERRITQWCNRWISRDGRLFLVKIVIEAILVYWCFLVDIPKGILSKIRKLCANYLWKGSLQFKGAHVACWILVARPKHLCGWGIRILLHFGKALAEKSLLQVLTKDSLWRNIIFQKYIAPSRLLEWIRNPSKNSTRASNHWRSLLKSYNMMGDHIAWKVRLGMNIIVGIDAIVGCETNIFLPQDTILILQNKGMCTLDKSK